MNILIIHPHFPAQFSHLAPALAKAGHTVVALTMQASTATQWEGVRLVPFALQRSATAGVHPWLAELEGKIVVGEACMRAAVGLKAEGFEPQVILAHSGWGEGLFVKDVWPEARLGICCDYFRQSADGDFDAEFVEQDPLREGSLRVQQLAQRLQFDRADQGMVPTRWQADSFPKAWRDRLTVVPEGIDIDALGPKEDISLTLNGQLSLTRQDEVITFVCRELSPQVGFHVFMRALPDILNRRPHAHVLIAGGDGVVAGTAGGRGWRESLIAELRSQAAEADWRRVHFVGELTAPQWVGLLQLSTVHVQMRYPSAVPAGLLEAMGIGCAVVGSRTAPLEAIIQDGETGRLVDFFDSRGLADEVCRLLDAPEERARLGRQAREFVRKHHDARTVCLSQQLAWVEGLAAVSSASPLGADELRNSLKDILALL